MFAFEFPTAAQQVALQVVKSQSLQIGLTTVKKVWSKARAQICFMNSIRYHSAWAGVAKACYCRELDDDAGFTDRWCYQVLQTRSL